jgi:hypothetical protein
MRTRLFCPILAVAAAVTAMLGIADRADAAIRITISDGTSANTKVFYSNSNDAIFATNLGALDAVVETAFSNYPGTAEGGILTQQVTLSDAILGAPLTNFFFTADVIGTVAGFGPGTFEATGNTNVTGAALALFTQPANTSLGVTSTVSGRPTLGSSTGTVQNNTTVNGGTPVSTNPVPLNDMLGTGTGTRANDPSLGYTLSSQVVLLNASPGVLGLQLTANSLVTAPADAGLTPEPASLAIWGLGAMALVVGAGARRFCKMNG